LRFKQIIDSAMAAKLDGGEASAASLPNAQLVECLCQSSWDISDPSFTDFVVLISGGHMEPEDWFDKAEVMLHHGGSRAPAWPPAPRAPLAPCAPCPVRPPGSP